MRYSLLVVAGSVALLGGCGFSTKLVEAPKLSESFIPTAPRPTAVCAFIASSKATVNGQDMVHTPGYLKIVADRLAQTGLFSPVAYDPATAKLADTSKCAAIRLATEEAYDHHNLANAGKAFVDGLTLFLLSPVVKPSIDYSQRLAVTVTLPDKSSRSYEAMTKGEGDFYPYADQTSMYQELSSKVQTANLNSIGNQVGGDSSAK